MAELRLLDEPGLISVSEGTGAKESVAARDTAFLVCIRCGKWFVVTHHRGSPRKYCTASCRNAAWREKNRRRKSVFIRWLDRLWRKNNGS